MFGHLLVLQICLRIVCVSYRRSSVNSSPWRRWAFTTMGCVHCAPAWATSRPSPTSTSGNSMTYYTSIWASYCSYSFNCCKHCQITLWFTIKFQFGPEGKRFGTPDLVGKVKKSYYYYFNKSHWWYRYTNYWYLPVLTHLNCFDSNEKQQAFVSFSVSKMLWEESDLGLSPAKFYCRLCFILVLQLLKRSGFHPKTRQNFTIKVISKTDGSIFSDSGFCFDLHLCQL